MRSVAQEFRVSLCTVQWWTKRAHGCRLDRVDWTNRPPIPHHVQRTERATEDFILRLRRELKETSDLGEYGARAIHRALIARGKSEGPAVRTINRILHRRGVFDGWRRVRRPPPPPGWYLPAVAARQAELDSFDFVEGLVIQGGPQVEVLNAISLHGSLVASWPGEAFTAKAVAAAVLTHWQSVGLPAYAQFDNDTRFQGPHQHPDVVSRVMRLCLSLAVIPVFAPPREHGFQNALENFNGRWQGKVWARFHHESLAALQAQSARFVTASRQRSAARIDAAPTRRPFPSAWALDLQAQPRGHMIFLRRTNDSGVVSLLGHTFVIDAHWPHRLVRCDLDLDGGLIRCYALRRRQPDDQPLLRELPYELPTRPFKG